MLADNDPAEQEKLIKFNTLLANLVIFHNALDIMDIMDIMDIVRGLVAEGWTITADQLGALSPYLRGHISRFGAYATDELGRHPGAFNPVLKEVDFTTCGCRKPCHHLRPGHSGGSGRRGDPAAEHRRLHTERAEAHAPPSGAQGELVRKELLEYSTMRHGLAPLPPSRPGYRRYAKGTSLPYLVQGQSEVVLPGQIRALPAGITNRVGLFRRAPGAADMCCVAGAYTLPAMVRAPSAMVVYTCPHRCSLHVRSDVPVRPGSTRYPPPAADTRNRTEWQVPAGPGISRHQFRKNNQIEQRTLNPRVHRCSCRVPHGY